MFCFDQFIFGFFVDRRLSELYDAGVVRTPVDILRLKSRTIPPAAMETPAEEAEQGQEGTGDAPPPLREDADGNAYIVPEKKEMANLRSEAGVPEEVGGVEDIMTKKDAGQGAKKRKARKKNKSVTVESTLEGREGWGRQSAQNVFDAVEKAKDVTLGR